MKRVLLYIMILTVLMVVPVQGNDVGKLRPVQAITFYKEGDDFVLETDTDDRGVGATPMDALANLKDTTPAVIYLDTAEFMLVSEDSQNDVEQLRSRLKNSVKLCLTEEYVEPKAAAEFLKVHSDLPKLKNWEYPEKLPRLGHFGERLKILPENENNA